MVLCTNPKNTHTYKHFNHSFFPHLLIHVYIYITVTPFHIRRKYTQAKCSYLAMYIFILFFKKIPFFSIKSVASANEKRAYAFGDPFKR